MNQDNLAINTLKISGIRAVNEANSGHPGIVLGAAKITHTLFTRHLVFNPADPKFINRDRFILSAGHGSALLYAQLRLLNLVSTDDLKNFRQYQSKTPGHPEFGLTSGIEATTGPLGQGIAMGVGIALAEASLNSQYSEIDHFTYVLCGDGDLQEGVAMEAMSFAGHQKLNKLIVLHDSNKIQLDTPVNKVFSDNLELRFKAIGWDYQVIENDVEAIDKAIAKAKKTNAPSFIEVKTIIGEGATKANTSDVHGAPLGDDIKKVRKFLDWNEDDFYIPEEVKTLYQETIFIRGQKASKSFKPSKALTEFMKEIANLKIKLNLKTDEATRVTSGQVIEYLNNKLSNWIGGSADLSGSTKAAGGNGVFSPQNLKGKNILFGVREFAMGAIANGIALHSNFKVFVSTFFVFSDYLKPSMRLAALMNLPVTYIFTHDSVFVGEDGPTHQPIEHLAMLRSIPNLKVLRPADEIEVLGAYELAINATKNPTAILLTRQNIVSTKKTNKDAFKKGSYYLRKTNKSPWTLVASGSELANAYKIGEKFDLNVVSFSHATNEIDWDVDHAISIEAATTYGLKKWAKYNIGINTFGESAPGNQVYKHFKLDLESLTEQINAIIK